MAIIGRRRLGVPVEIPKITHKELVNKAEIWLRGREGCSIIVKELSTSNSETPDVIGFKGRYSVLIECKTSRADFLADKKKGFRRNSELGMGCKRYFMAPAGLLEPEELPEGWGLIDVYEKKHGHRVAREAKPSEGFPEVNRSAEVAFLVSIIRRLQLSMAAYVIAQDDTKGGD